MEGSETQQQEQTEQPSVDNDLAFLVGEENVINEEGQGEDIYADELKPTEEVSSETQEETEVVSETEDEGTEQVETQEETQQAPVTEFNDESRLSFLNEMFGEGSFETLDDFKSQEIVSKANEYNSLLEEFNSQVDEINELQSKEPEFATELSKEFDTWMKNGGDPSTFFGIQTAQFDDMKPLDVMAFQMKKEHPNLSDSEVKGYLSRKYKQDPDRYDEEEVEAGAIDLKIDSGKAAQSLKEIQRDTSVPDSKKLEDEAAEALTTRMKPWDKGLSTVIDDFKGIDINVGDLDLTWNVNPEEAQGLKEDMYSIIEYAGLEHNEEGIAYAKQALQNRYISENFESIIKTVVAKVTSMKTEENHKESHNPSALKDETSQVDVDKPKTQSDMIYDHFMNQG